MPHKSTIDVWTDECGGTLEVLDHGQLVEIFTHSGDALILGPDDALRVYAALESWIARKNLESPVSELMRGLREEMAAPLGKLSR